MSLWAILGVPSAELTASVPPAVPTRTSPKPAPPASAVRSTASSALETRPDNPEATRPPSAPPALPSDDGLVAREPVSARVAPAPAAPATEPTVAAVDAPSRPMPADEERAVRDVVRAYASAYSGLDVDAVKAVFPGINDAALRRAFRSLRSQRVELRGVAVAVSGNAASVSGTWVSSAVGQVGKSTPRRDERPVIFTLEKRDGAWVIVTRR